LSKILDFPLLIFVFSFVILWLSERAGALVARRHPLKEDEKDDLDRVSNAGLTLLALIIGFSFSMAVSRYDLRKAYEEEEANAIGTEYVRTDLLPVADAARVRNLLVQYLDQRLRFYTAKEFGALDDINAQTAKLQDQMWSAVQDVARTQPTPPIALVVSGMNDVLNRQGYTQAAWWNRIPPGAWCLMIGIAICSSLLIGYSAHATRGLLFGVMPLLVSIAFLFIADIDSPRRGIIHVHPQNLISLSQSLRGH
jgi:cell division protein FtsL